MSGSREYRTGSSEQLITCGEGANVVSETSCRRHSGTGGEEQKQERRRQDKSSEAQPKTKKGTCVQKIRQCSCFVQSFLFFLKLKQSSFQLRGYQSRKFQCNF